VQELVHLPKLLIRHPQQNIKAPWLLPPPQQQAATKPTEHAHSNHSNHSACLEAKLS